MSTQQRTLGSVADLMAGLMMVFLFIAIAYMIQVKSSQKALEDEARKAIEALESAEKARALANQSKEAAEQSRLQAEEGKRRSDEARAVMSEIAGEYATSKAALDKALHEEFDPDLIRWRAEIDNGSIRFLEPDVLFDSNSSQIKPQFLNILDDFFPRYLEILTSEKFRNEIEEVRIEGHTSTEWRFAANDEDRYLKNAELSQRRAFSVLNHCFSLPASRSNNDWLIKILRANGLSFSTPVVEAEGNMNPERSRRVEFQVITRTTEKIRRIIETNTNQSTAE